jgi:hypothetical protein
MNKSVIQSLKMEINFEILFLKGTIYTNVFILHFYKL